MALNRLQFNGRDDPDLIRRVNALSVPAFEGAQTEDDLRIRLASEGLEIHEPVNNLRVVLLHRYGLAIGTVIGDQAGELKTREEIHAWARQIAGSPEMLTEYWSLRTAQIWAQKVEREVRVREAAIEAEQELGFPGDLDGVPLPPFIGNEDLLNLLQKTDRPSRWEIERMLFEIIREVVVRERVPFYEVLAAGR